jgi:hypothetical protein
MNDGVVGNLRRIVIVSAFPVGRHLVAMLHQGGILAIDDGISADLEFRHDHLTLVVPHQERASRDSHQHRLRYAGRACGLRDHGSR